MTDRDWIAAAGFLALFGFFLVAIFMAFFTGGGDD